MTDKPKRGSGQRWVDKSSCPPSSGPASMAERRKRAAKVLRADGKNLPPDKRFALPSPSVITTLGGGPDRKRPIDFTDPHFRRDMSPEDEKRTDHQGRPAVLGLPWSQAGTGLWLMIGCVRTDRPKAPSDGFWGSLELPSDLASDALKRKYVTEWICNEVDKAIGQAGL